MRTFSKARQLGTKSFAAFASLCLAFALAPGDRTPVTPLDIIRLTLSRAHTRTGLDPVHFRPWLQAFRDYAFDRRKFGADQIRDQIKAAESFGSDGWMLWNPRNVYTTAGLTIRPAPEKADAQE